MRPFIAAIFLLSSLSLSAQMIPWLTRGGDQTHSGWNSHETTLTQASVKAHGVSLQPPIPVIGDARGMEAQPLIEPRVKVADGSIHDVMILPSMADVVRGVDAETGAGLWQTTLGMPLQGSPLEDIYGINDKWGCLATGVIDPSTNRVYLPCQYSPDGSGSWSTSRYAMFILDIATGKEVVPPVQFAGMMTVDGHGVPQDFNATWRKLRASAVMLPYQGRNIVIECGGSVYMTKPGVTGFCSAFDTVTNKFTDFEATTQGRAGNVWMSGGAPAVLDDGSILFVTATGGFDGVSELSESIIRMTYDGQKLHFIDHFTPYRDRVRTGQDSQSAVGLTVSKYGELKSYPGFKGIWNCDPPQEENMINREIAINPCGVAGEPVMISGANPSTGNFGPQVNICKTYDSMQPRCSPGCYGVENKMPAGFVGDPTYTCVSDSLSSLEKDVPVNGHAMAMPDLKGARTITKIDPYTNQKVSLMYPPIAAGTWADEDLGSAQPAVIPSLDLALVTGKDGIAYPVRIHAMGNTQPSDLTNPPQNCKHLMSEASFVTAYTGMNACPADDTSLNFLVNGDTVHQHFAPLVMPAGILGQPVVFYSGENQPVKEYVIGPNGQPTFRAQTQEISSANVATNPGGGMTGAGCAGSSNGNDPNSALLVCVYPYGDANKTVTNGRMVIYDPVHIVNRIMPKLWDSQDWGWSFKFNKFDPPFIDGGEIIYATYDGRVFIIR